MPDRTPLSETAAVEYRAAVTGAALFDRSDAGKVELAGKEAVFFLQNLCTNDVKSLPVGAGCEAFLTNLKARVIAHVFIYRLAPEKPEVVWLDTGPGMGERTLKHLDRHLISEQVELADRTREYAQVHLCGPQAPAVLEKVLGGAALALDELRHEQRPFGGGAVQVRRHDLLNLPGYDLLCPAADAPTLRQALCAAGAAPAGQEAFEVLRVEAGVPVYGADIDENRFVVEVGRIRQTICYTKGCYLGQEPIVMARDRGHVNRTLLGLTFPEGGAVPPGAKVFRDGQEVGQVTSSVVSPRLGRAVALAYLRRGSQEAGTAVEVEVEGGRRPGIVAALPLVDHDGLG